MKKGKLTGKIFGIELVFVMLTSTLGGLVWARESDVVGAGYVDVSVEQAKGMIDSDPDVIVLDVRTEDEYEPAHIADARLVPLSELEQRTGELDKDDALLVYCKSGTKSAEASNILIQYEFESVYNMEGGINAWVNAGYPIVSSSIGDQSGQGCSCADSQSSIASVSTEWLGSEIDAVLDSNKPVFLFFYADWCHFCHEQMPIIDELEHEYTGEISFICVNAEDDPQAMQEFGVTGFPAMFLITEKGENVEYVGQEFKGFTDKETLKESFDYLIENGSLPEGANDYSIGFDQTESENLSIVSQESLSLAEFQAELANDAEFKELHDYSREFGYFYPSDIEKTIYSNGASEIVAGIVSIENSSIFLSRFSFVNESHSILMEVGNESVTFLDKEGWTQIDIANNCISECDEHHSCNRKAFVDACYRKFFLPGALELAMECSKPYLEIGRNVPECAKCIYYSIVLCPKVCAGGPVPCTACYALAALKCLDCGLNWYEVNHCTRLIKEYHDNALKCCEAHYDENPCLLPYEGNTCPVRHCSPEGYALISEKWVCRDYRSMRLITEECVNCEYKVRTEDVPCPEDMYCDMYRDPETGEWGAQCVASCIEFPEVCDDGDPCTRDECDVSTGKCIHKSISPCCGDGACESSESWLSCPEDCPQDPGGDHPDDNYDVSTPKITLNNGFDSEVAAAVAILFKGFATSTASLLESFNESTTFVDIGFSPDLVDDYPIVIIPSGGLYGLDSLPSFKSNLEEYVENGGTLIVFSQQHGYEYSALPGGEVSGFGWLEDQSCHHGSVGINTYHPILSGQDSVISDMSVDGFFTSYPDDSTILLKRTKNGMPAMLMYEYGNGTVIATTAYTDWAYGRGQATQDGIHLVRDMIAWCKYAGEIPGYGPTGTVDIPIDVFNVHLPIPEVEYPQYAPGDVVSIPIDITNYADQACDKVVFSVFNPDYDMEDIAVSVSIPPAETTTVDFTYETTESSKTGVYLVLYSLYAGETVIGEGFGRVFALGVDASELSTYKVNFILTDPDKTLIHEETTTVILPAGGNETVTFSYTNPSKLGIWSLEYEVLDYNDKLINSGEEMFAVSKFAENPDGWVYQGENLQIWATSPSQHVVRGSVVLFTIYVKNEGDTSFEGDIDVFGHEQGGASWAHYATISNTTVPPHSQITLDYSHEANYSTSFYFELIDQYEGHTVADTELGIWIYNPSIDVDIATGKTKYIRGEDVSIFLNLNNNQDPTYDVSTTVRVLDRDNFIVYEDALDVSLPGGATHERTFGFSLPIDAKYGAYIVSAVAYVDGDKVGSGSTYFEVSKGCIVRVIFDHPNNSYRARESMTVELEAVNVATIPWNSNVDISIPDLGFSDSVDFALDPGQTDKVSYDLSIPEDIATGKHDVTVTVSLDNTIEEFYFLVPESKLILDVDQTSYNAGEALCISLTNSGGIDTTADCSMEFSDSHGLVIHESSSLESILAGQSNTLAFTIPDQVVSGDYYVIGSCRDLSTDIVAKLSKSVTVEGLEASLTSITDKKTYFNTENIAIYTDIMNLDGAIVDGVLNLKIVRPRSLEEEGWIRNPANGHYHKLTTPMDWLQAEAQAVQWGGHLVTVNDRDEELWLREQFGSQEHFWIGFNDLDVESNWEWVSGEPVSYTNWAEGEPNNHQEEDAAVMNWAPEPELYGDSWNDLSISGQYRGIVEALLESAHQISEHTNITPDTYTDSPSGSTSWTMASIAAKKNVVASDPSNEAWILPRQDSASSRDYDRVTNVYTNDLANFYTSSGIKDTYVASDYTSLKHIQQASELAEEYMPKPTPVPVAGYQRGVVSPKSLMSGRDRAWERTAADASRNICATSSDQRGINPFNNAMLRYESVASDPRVTSYIRLNFGANGSIAGFVYEEDGVTLIEGATVKVQNWDAEFFQFVGEGTTNASGAYVISGLNAGEYRVLASATGRAYELYHETYLWDEAQPVSVTEGEDTPNINFSLGPGGTISGLITSADSGVPLSQVSVLASYADSSPVGGWALSDPSGNYTINSLPYGTYIVQSPSDWRFGTSDDGYLMEFWQEKSNWDDADTVTVSEVVHPTDIDFTLEVGGTISGVVEDEVGDPIEGAWVYALGDDVSGWGSNQSTEDGSYTITGLPSGSYCVQAQASGYICEYYDDVYDWSAATPVSVTATDDTPNINFSLEVGGTISGVVKDESGDPIEGAWIYASGDDISGWGGNQSTEDGSYTITGLPSGSYRVYAQAPGYIREYYDDVYDWSAATLVSVNAPNDTPNIDFTLEVGGTISGIVDDEFGDPIEGAWVYASGDDVSGWGSNQSTEDGSYTITGLPSGSYRVYAQASGYIREYYDDVYDWSAATPVSVTATDDTPNINFSLEVGGTISGVVKDESGDPIPDLHVYAEDYNRGDWMGGTNTNPDGSYTITGLPTGIHRVKACASCSGLQYVDEFYDDAYHWRWETATPVSVTAPNDTPNIDFTLEISGFISGTVLDQNTGEPLDATCESVNLDIGWHKFVYRHEEYEGGQASRAAFKAPGDTDWRWFSTSELMVSISLEPDAESGILLCNKKNTWEYNPGNHAELVACVDVDSTEEDGWYGCSIVDAVNQDGNIHGNDEYFTSYYEGYFYVETAGTWYFSTDSDDASEIVIDDQVVSYWYGGHGPANMWEQRGGITAYWYDTDEWVDYMNVNTDGSYTLGNLPSGSYIVEATAIGYIHEYYEESVSWDEATTVIVAAPNTSTNVSFTLERGGTISGVVKDEVGEPIPNVHVDAESYDTGGEMHDADTDQYGYYIITEVPSGTYRVRACSSCDGLPYLDEYYDDTYNYDDATPVPVTAPDDTPNINFNLEIGGTISGHVCEDDGITPIPNCDVNAETLDGEYWRSAQTDSNGHYIIIGLFSGDYKVNAQCEPYAREFWEEKAHWDEADIVSVTAPNDTPNINFTLEVGGTISGHVYQEDGETPIPNVHVYAQDYYTDDWMAGTNTGSDGSYTLVLPAGTYRVRACPSCNGLNYVSEWYDDTYHGDEAIPVSVTAPDDTPNIDFNLVQGGSVSGYVYEEDGTTPITKIPIDFWDYETGIGMGDTDTAEDGSYTMIGLPTGTYRVRACATCDGFNYINEWYDDTYYEDEATPVSVTASDDTPNIDFTLELGGTISGMVEDGEGNPIKGAYVRAEAFDNSFGDDAETDSEGQYTIYGLPSGEYRVEAEAEGFAREFYDDIYYEDEATSVSVTAPNDTPGINFILEVGGTISGHVYQEDGVTPIPNCNVYAEDYDTGIGMGGTSTDKDGSYSVVLPSGTYQVWACGRCEGLNYIDEWYDDTYYYDEATPVPVTAPDDTSNIDFTLEVGGTISGHVYKEDGTTPITNIPIDFWDYETGIGMGNTNTAEDGSYTMIGLPSGTYRVRACPSCDGLNYVNEFYDDTYYEDEATPVSVTAPNDTPGIDFILEVGGIISGVIKDEIGEPIHNVRVSAEDYDRGDEVANTDTNLDGSYSLVVPTGTYRVRAWSSCSGLNYVTEWYDGTYYENEATPVSVTALDDTPNIDFTLEVGGTISGHVYQEDGATPIRNVHVYAEDYGTGAWMDGTNTGRNGSYTLVLPTGTYWVAVCPSCSGLDYVREWYDGTYYSNEATPVSATAPDDTPNIDFILEIGGTISGHVYQEDGTTPIRRLHVYAEDYDMGVWMEGTDTGSDGSYSLILPTGTYRVRACPSHHGLDYWDEWYDNTPDREEAAPVPVVAPNETEGIDFTLTRPTLTLTPSSGGVGTFVTVNGSDMTPSSVIPVGNLTFADIPWNEMDIPIDSAGNIVPTTLIVPMVGPGPHTVTATDSAGVTARATFWVTAIVWEEDISVNMSALGFLNLITDISIPTEMPGTTGKLDLIATLYSSSSQIINQSERYSLFIFDQDLSLTLETHKEVYKPNETIMVFGEVQNNSEIAGGFSLSVSKDGEEIFADFFTLDQGEIHSYTTSINSNSSFTLEATVDGVTITDFVSIIYPNVDVTIIAPDIVGLSDFDVGVLMENTAGVDSDLHVSMADKAWDVVIPPHESRLIESTMSIIEDTTLLVEISGDIHKVVQKQIVMGESALINISPQAIYLEGPAEIPFTVVNTGVMDTEFEAVFSIGDQLISRTIFLPQGQSITDTLSFNLTQGKHTLGYSSPFEDGSVEIHVSVPEFEITAFPSNLSLTVGQQATWTFRIGNAGGAEGEATLHLMLPDWEDTKLTWIRPGDEQEISFTFSIPDDLEEKEYNAIYELDGSRGEFTFLIEGVDISMLAGLDKHLYEEGETAILTLDIINECEFDLSLYARVQLNEYEEIQPFHLLDTETLYFNVPISFNGHKLFYGIYMESGRALYLNSIYIQEKRDIITLYTDKQVYTIGETVTVFVETADTGTLNLTAPGYSTEIPLDGSITLSFVVPALRSGTYYIDYTFDGFSSSYPFDVIGYSARILEFSLDKDSYMPGETMRMYATIDVNRDVEGLLSIGLYNSEYDMLDKFDIPTSFIQGDNKIEADIVFSGDTRGIYSLVYGVYGDLPGHSLVLLASGAEYFDGISGNTPPVADAGPDQTVCVISPATTAMVTLDGSGSYDADGDPLTYTWSWDTDTAHGVNPTVELPLGTTIITLIVNDGKVNSEPDTVDITIAINQYSLTISSTAGGTVTTPGEGPFTYDAGTVVDLVATPDANHHFVEWTGDVDEIADAQSATTTITMNGNYEIVANFEEIPPVQYSLTISSTSGGTVTTPGEGPFTYDAGTVVDLVASPASGYQFVNWTGDVGTIANVKAATTSITMNGDYEITANFGVEEIPPVLQYSLTISSTAGGSVTEPGEGTFGPYDAGTVVDLVATPASGYKFVNWTGDVSTIDDVDAASTSITMNGNYEITANFEEIPPVLQYSLTISSTTVGSVTEPGEGTSTHAAGTQVNLVATPDEGYQFIKWDGDVDTIADTQAAETAITMNGDYSIIALFGKTETVTDGTVDAKDVADTDVVVDGTATVSVAKYADNPGGPPPTGFSALGKYIDVYVPNATNVTQIEIRLYYTAAEVAEAGLSEESLRLLWLDGTEWRQCSPPACSGVNATATNGYSGYLWVRIGTNTTPTLAQLTGMPFGAYSTPTVEYDLIIDSTEGGKVTKPGEGEFTYDAGTVVDLVATPDANHHFVEWTGDVDEIADAQSATTTITMNGDYTITANFAREVTPVPPGPGPAPTPTRYLMVDWDENITRERLYSNDRLSVDLLAPSPNGSHSLFLERGTHAPVVDGKTHYLIEVREVEEIPAVPENTEAIVAFEITPSGAVFDRDIFLTLGLDELELPENAQNLTMAYYDDVNRVWVPLEYEGVAELTLSGAINHFSIFGVLAELIPTPPPPPAHFVTSDLSIVTCVERIWEPVTFVTKIGESVTITANVANDGGQGGTYTVVLKLNGETVDTKIVTLGAGQSQQVSFTVSGLDYGQYEVEVAGLSGEFTTSRTITWWLIIVIIAAIGLIIWGVAWGRRRRRRAAQEG